MGSNPAPATKKLKGLTETIRKALFLLSGLCLTGIIPRQLCASQSPTRVLIGDAGLHAVRHVGVQRLTLRWRGETVRDA